METRSEYEILVTLEDGRLKRRYEMLSVKSSVMPCRLANTYKLSVNLFINPYRTNVENRVSS